MNITGDINVTGQYQINSIPLSGTTSSNTVPLQVSGGFGSESTQAEIEAKASSNVIMLRQAIEQALCDPNDPYKAQEFTGVISLPAGRIYLNERITIEMPPTSGHNIPNSLTIQGVGQGGTQLCWTNESSSHGIKVVLGPYGAALSQKITVKNMDFVLGNQGVRDGNGVGVPLNASEGALGAEGIALEITGDRLDLDAAAPGSPTEHHATIAGYDKQTGKGHIPSGLIENCNFMGWHRTYAGWNKCLIIEDAQLTDVKGCCFTGALTYGDDTCETAIHITGDAKATDYYLECNRFFSYKYGVLCNGNIEGVTIHQSTWVNTHHGVWWEPQKVLGGDPEYRDLYDTTTGAVTGIEYVGSTDGTPQSGIAQWPLLVLTDCHMNCIETCARIISGWQVLIKGCSFYGIQIGAAYGAGYNFSPTHRSIWIDHQSSNCNIYGNTFADTSSSTELSAGGWGPSIECDGHLNMIHGNLFVIDSANPVFPQGRDEPHVLLSSRASGNVVQNNMAIQPLDQNIADNGVSHAHEKQENISLYIEDNNTGVYNGQLIIKNHVINNGTDTDLSPIGTQLHRTTHMDYGKGDYYGNPIHHGRFEIQRTGELTNGHANIRATATPWNQNDTYNTGDEVVILQTEPTSAMSIGTSAFFVAQQDGLTGTLSNPLSTTSTGQWKWTTSSTWPYGNDEVSSGFVGFPANYAGTKAPMVVQSHHDTDIGPYPEPGVVYDFEATGGGEVNAELEFSNSIFWGVYSNTRKYNNGSGHSFTANTQLHEHPPLTGYNEAACYTGEVINHGAARGTMSGVEVRCVDSADPQDPDSFSADTKMISVIGRMHRSFDGERLNHCFAASSEGPVPVDSMLKALTNPAQFPHVGPGAAGFKEGIDMSGVDFTTKGALIVPEGHELKGADSSGTRYSVMRPGADKNNPFEVWVDNQWKKVEIGPSDSGGTGYRALRVLN